MAYTTWPSAATRANPSSGGSVVEQPGLGALALTGLAPTVVASGSVAIDFTSQSVQDPLSLGGTWSNNTQGVGGNVAPNNLASMQIALSSDGATKIACCATAPIVDYDDSFAFKPGVIGAGGVRVTAEIFRAAGYNPSANHEIELILGCATTSGGNHRWIECVWSTSGGSFDIIDLNGQPNGFTNIGAPTGNFSGGPSDGQIWVAEYLIGSPNRVRWGRKVAGVTTWGCDTLGQPNQGLITGLGSGAGIAGFRRSGDTNTLSYGFRNILIEPLP